MVEMENFIPELAFLDMPSEPGLALSYLYKYASQAYETRSKSFADTNLLSDLRRRFMLEISAVVEELGYKNILRVPGGSILDSEWNEFIGCVAALKARGSIKARSNSSVNEVTVTRITKHKLFLELASLREQISNVDIEEWRRKALLKKIDELIKELHRDRITLRNLITLAAAVASIAGGTTTALAKGPEAQATVFRIIEWVDGELQAEDLDKQLRLPQPSKALPAPSEMPAAHITDQRKDADALDS